MQYFSYFYISSTYLIILIDRRGGGDIENNIFNCYNFRIDMSGNNGEPPAKKNKVTKPRVKWENWEEEYLTKLIERSYPRLGKLQAKITKLL